MIGYKDRTWCSQKNCKNKCNRQFTEEDRVAAQKWWGSESFPISVKEYCDENGELHSHSPTG